MIAYVAQMGYLLIPFRQLVMLAFYPADWSVVCGAQINLLIVPGFTRWRRG